VLKVLIAESFQHLTSVKSLHIVQGVCSNMTQGV